MTPPAADSAALGAANAFLDSDLAASMLEASADCIKLLNLDGTLQYMNRPGVALMEVGDPASIYGKHYTVLWPEEHAGVICGALEKARSGEVARFSGDCPTARGTPKWWDVIVSPVAGPDGKPKMLLAVSRDITESKRAAEASALLAQEAAHRVKNFFAVVDGLIALAARRAPSDTQAFAGSLRARLAALGRTATYLGPLNYTEGDPRSLHGLLTELFAAYGETPGGQIDVRGEDAMVGRAGAASLALALHELATNAVKYGALSRPGGRVVLAIGREDDAVTLRWEERGGPAAPAPTRSGFGSTLIDNSVNTYLSGALERDWGDDGLAVRMRLSAEALAR